VKKGNVKRGKSPTKGASEAASFNRRQAYDLRIQGLTYQGIADRLKVSVKTAFYYINDQLREHDEVCKESAEQVRSMELKHLGELQARWLPIALSDKLEVSKMVERGEDTVKVEWDAFDAGLKAVDRVLKIQERRAKLLGLEAPQKIDVSGHLTLDELQKRYEEGQK
jgi:hypothetical protein